MQDLDEEKSLETGEVKVGTTNQFESKQDALIAEKIPPSSKLKQPKILLYSVIAVILIALGGFGFHL